MKRTHKYTSKYDYSQQNMQMANYAQLLSVCVWVWVCDKFNFVKTTN